MTVTTVLEHSTPTIELLQYAPNAPNSQLVTVPVSAYSPSGDIGGPFTNLAPPVPAGSSTPINLSNPVPLVNAINYAVGEPVFIQVTDPGANMNPTVVETVAVTIKDSVSGDSEVVRLTETGPNTGVFTGYIQSSGLAVKIDDGLLEVADDSLITASYTDLMDNTSTVTATAIVDPFGKVFSTTTGLPVSGAAVTLLDASTGQPAKVFGDDGVSTFPATITSGGVAVDSIGKSYSFPPGEYRYPFIPPGSYRISVAPPTGYRFPSQVATNVIQALPNGPFYIVDPGSRGEVFYVNSGPAVRIDLPVDASGSTLFLTKSVSQSTASIGDFVQYVLAVQNVNTAAPAVGVSVSDHLPFGFAYKKSSANIAGVAAPDPTRSSDGRTLTFNIGNIPAGATVQVSYVVEIAAGARVGTAVNTAVAANSSGQSSNTAQAAVQVENDFFSDKSTIMGRVSTDGCGNHEAGSGLAGVRLFMENGLYVITDKKGMYHFVDVTPGTHVVQLDTASIPANYEVVSCDENNRFAGSNISQFVDTQGGTLWRADFYLREKEKKRELLKSETIEGDVGIELRSVINGVTTEDGKETAAVDFSVAMHTGKVPLKNLRLTVMLPKGLTYTAGSSSLEDAPLNDPAVLEGTFTYRIGEVKADWDGTVRFKAAIPSVKAGEFSTKAMLTFDLGALKNQRTHIVDNLLVIRDEKGDNSSRFVNKVDDGATKLPFSITRPVVNGTEAQEEERKKENTANKTMPDYDASWLEKTGPGVQWLWPREGYHPPIPSASIAVKYDPMKKFKLLLNNEELDEVFLDSTVKGLDGKGAINIWTGIHLEEGDNIFELVAFDEAGVEISRERHIIHYSRPPVNAELAPAQSKLVADGRSPVVIAVRLTDKDGHPAREGVIGEFSVNPPYTARKQVEELKRNLLTESTSDKFTYKVGRDGIALIELQPTMQTGEAVIRLSLMTGTKEIRVWVKPGQRDWILVGLAEGTVGYNVVKNNMESYRSEGGDDDRLYDHGRVAFYATGSIKGEWLLTMAADTKRVDEGEQKSLNQTVDPNKYYTLYGDGTNQQPAASSYSRIYLKIERNQFYALFGDYDTGLTVTELSRYSRTFNGIKSEMRSRNFDYTVYAARADQSFVKDEIQGNGTSGLYHLSRQNIIINSEVVTMETRDRFRSEVIISSQQMSPYVDYSIDYQAGTIYFKSPVFSRDADLNPIFIVVNYELNSTTGNAYDYGGRGAVKVLDGRVQVGVSHIHEEANGGTGNLTGVDATVKVTDKITVKTEYAYSSSDESAISNGVAQTGSACIAEVAYKAGTIEGSAYVRDLSSGFGLGQQNSSETGTQKFGYDLTYKMTPTFSLSSDAFEQHYLTTGTNADMAELKGTYTQKRYDVFGGVRYATDSFDTGGSATSDQIFAGTRYRITDRLSASLEYDQSLGGTQDGEFPTSTTLNADYKLNNKATLFAAEEWTFGSASQTNTTRVGIKAAPWTNGQLSSTMEDQTGENSERLFSTLGLKQSWQLSKQWSFDAGLDRSETLLASNASTAPPAVVSSQVNPNMPPVNGTTVDFTAVSLGTGYKQEKWAWTGRTEYRFATDGKNLNILSGFDEAFRKDIGLAASLQAFTTQAPGSTEKKIDARFGMVYRPEETRWILLDRLDFLIDDLNNVVTNGVPTTDTDNWRIVNNFNANYNPFSKFQLSLEYGAKYVRDGIDSTDYTGYTDLTGVEGRYDINKKWDIGLRENMLHSWSVSQFQYGTGISVGYSFVKNMVAQVGYNITGFKDLDFSAANFTCAGPFIKISMKFDQVTAREAVKWITGQK